MAAPQSSSSYLFAVLVAAFILVAAYKLSHVGMRPKGYPPGPPTLPIIGNLHQFPKDGIHLQFQKWIQEYGPVVSLKLGTQTLILLGTAKGVSDLLDKKGAIYSTRMDVMFRKFGHDLNIAFHPYDDVWKRQRKVYHTRLNSKLADNYLPYQYFESYQLLHELLNDAENFRNHFERYTISIGCTIAFGKRVSSWEDQDTNILLEWFRQLVVAGASLQIADWWPIFRPLIRIIPDRLNPIKRYMRHLAEMELGLWQRLTDRARAHLAAGRYYPSLCRDMIVESEQNEKTVYSEREIWYNSGHAWAAATDTQSNTLLGFVKAMVLYPEVQTKAREEIDQVIGTERLPDWGDRPNLPYIRGCMEETMRWAPTAVTGGPMPHAAMKTDYYNGFTIPAGAGVFNCVGTVGKPWRLKMLTTPKVWTINNDPERFQDPRVFNPSRFSEADTAMDAFSITQNYSKRPHLTFGAGRRICPGSHVAERTLFTTMARLIWAFEFDFQLDEKGHTIPIKQDEFTHGLIVGPKQFRCKIKPRSEEKAMKIRDLFSDAQKWLDFDGNYTEEFFKGHWKGEKSTKI